MIEADGILTFGSWWIVRRLKEETIFTMENSAIWAKIERFC